MHPDSLMPLPRQRQQREEDHRRGEGHGIDPAFQRVDQPVPEHRHGRKRALSCQRGEFFDGEGYGIRHRDQLAETHERQDQADMKWGHQPVAELDCHEIEAQDDGDDEAEDGRQAPEREDADRTTQRQAQRQLLRRNALVQEVNDRHLCLLPERILCLRVGPGHGLGCL